MIDYKNFKVGDRFGETSGDRFLRSKYDESYEFSVSSNVTVQKEEIFGKEYNQYRWKAIRLKDNVEIDFLITEGLEHYGPKLIEVK